MLKFQAGSEDLRVRGVDGVSASLRTGEGPAQTGRQREHIHFFLHFFILFRPSLDGMVPIKPEEDKMLYSGY